MKKQGVITALITPFANHHLDEEGFVQNIRFQMENQIDGILLFGSTGEDSTLTNEEQIKMIQLAVREAKGKTPIYVGTGSNCTRKAIEKTKQAKDLGADIVSVVTPYYNKPTQEGIFRHFEAICTSVDIPLIIYNIPGRCGVNIETPTLERIADLPNVIGVKEASGNINQTGDVIHTIAKTRKNFCVLSGDDILTLPMISLGAHGVISVASNLIPDKVIAFVKAALQGNFDHARQQHHQLLPFFKAIFMETNPIPIKTAMQLCGMPSGICRLPLWQMTPNNLERLENLLAEMQLLMPISLSK